MRIIRGNFSPFLMVLTICSLIGSNAVAEDWRVSKSSGEVWLQGSLGQPISLSSGALLKAGETIRTGNGRVLLVRGEETILISPNSLVGLPSEQQKNGKTKILQKSGSILLDVQKKNVKHFEVETPYLAAVVKGTQFRVSVNDQGADVDVVEGKVEVSDFKSGEFVLVLPGQSAKVHLDGVNGLLLKGSGTFNPVQKGEPREASPELQKFQHANEKIEEAHQNQEIKGSRSKRRLKKVNRRVRITAPRGLKLDLNNRTNGLVRSSSDDQASHWAGSKRSPERSSGPAHQGKSKRSAALPTGKKGKGKKGKGKKGKGKKGSKGGQGGDSDSQ